jgi:hypothetical protein
MTSGPIALTPRSVALLRPATYELSGGFWAGRRRINTERSIPHALA